MNARCMGVLLFTVTVGAQAQSATPAIPDYTDAQRWGRLGTLSVSNIVAAIELGRSKGMSTDAIGTWLGDYYADSWAGGLDARQFAISVRLNALSQPQARVELPTFTDSLVVLRASSPELAAFGPDKTYRGVSLADYRAVFIRASQIIADHVGVDLQQRYDGDWLVLTIRNRYTAPHASAELRWGRAGFMMRSLNLDVIRFSKASGKSARDAGAESAKTWASTWTAADTPWRVFRGLTWNAMSDPDYVCEVQSASPTMVRARCNRPWMPTVQTYAERTGVSVEDYEAYMLAVEQGIATARGMSWEVQIDGDARVITVRKP